MSLYDLALAIAAFLIMITMFARLNDLRPDVHKSFIWWVRRVAFLQVIAACAMIIAAPIAENVPNWLQLTRLMFVWGVFGVFFTSPYQKPWWSLIMGEHRKKSDRPIGHRARLLDEFRALNAAFRRGEIAERRVGPADRRKTPDRRFSKDGGE